MSWERFFAVITWTWSENILNSLVDSNGSLLRIYLHPSFLLLTFYLLFPVVMANPQRFLGNSLLQWNNMAAAAASVLWHVELMFRTRQASATLLHISSGLQHNLTLQVRLDISLHLFSLHMETHKRVSFCLRPTCITHYFSPQTFYGHWNVAMHSNVDLSSMGETLIRKRRSILKDFKVICHSVWQNRLNSVTESENTFLLESDVQLSSPEVSKR